MNVMTLKQHRYKGKLKNIGDEYEFVGGVQRRLAIALGWIVAAPKYLAPDVKNVKPVVVIESSPKVKEEKFVVEAVLVEKPKRTYKRRDMVSDE